MFRFHPTIGIANIYFLMNFVFFNYYSPIHYKCTLVTNHERAGRGLKALCRFCILNHKDTDWY